MAEFKSKAMQQLAEKKADQSNALRQSVTSISRITSEVSSLKEKVGQLDGERGNNPAVRRSDFKPIASIKLKSDANHGDIEAIRQDVKALHNALIRISNILGTQAKTTGRTTG